jgi:hypothetical protein
VKTIIVIFASLILAARSPAADIVLSAKTPDAWVEAKPACVFPLVSTALPGNVDLLTAALSAGLSRMAVTPQQADRIEAQATKYPALGALSIDLSNSIEDNDHKPPKVNWHYFPVPGVRADHLDVLARPLLIQQAKIEYELTAEQADLELAEDRARRPILMLMGARHGHLEAMVSRADVDILCLAAAKHFAQKYDFTVKSLSLNLATPTDRSLTAAADVILGGEMYGTLHFRGQLNIADDLTATASDLSCEGTGPGGLTIEGMVTAGLLFYNGSSKPLVVFPFNAMQLTDVRVRLDDHLHISADFASR